MLSNTEALWRLEIGQCFRDHRRAAKFVEGLLRKAGLDKVERLAFPADGKTVFQDKAMPMAWDARIGRLRVTKAPIAFDDPVVADFRRHPFHLVRGSVRTARGGVAARLMTEEQMLRGCDARGAMIVTDPDTRVRGAVLRSIGELGALGFVTDGVRDRHATPDGICWVNGCSEDPSWHVDEDARPFIGFSVAPRVGDRLRQAARMGEVRVRVECDGRRYAGEIDLVTAVLPGRDRRELWLLSHLYEPMPDDNSAGTIAAIEIARTIRRLADGGRLPRPRFTLRVVLGLEMYGFAAYAHRRGGALHGRVLGAMNMDAIAVQPGTGHVDLAGSPFFGDYLMEELFLALRDEPDSPMTSLNERGAYCDDMFLGDPTVGLPTIWPRGKSPLWHNSRQNMDVIDPACFRKAAAFAGAWTARMLTLEHEALGMRIRAAAALAERHMAREAAGLPQRTAGFGGAREKARKAMHHRRRREEARLHGFAAVAGGSAPAKAVARLRATADRVESNLMADLAAMPGKASAAVSPERGLWERIAATIVPARAAIGFPHDLRNVPKARRRPLPDSVIYGPFACVLANMDGKKTLEELAQEAAWERGLAPDSGAMRRYIGAVELLTEFGYLKTRFERSVSARQIVAALRRAGVGRGDLIVVHSGLAALGHVDGGPDTVIDAFLDVLGTRGTLLMPAFTHSETCVGGSALCRRDFRPYHRRKSVPCTGRIAAQFQARPGVSRSAHPTHSVAGVGLLAEACLGDHRETDPPVSRNSPFGRLLDHDGKMVWLGADLAATTFFHLLEDELRLPYLADALCGVERPDGRVETVHVPRYLPGHRDFYRRPAETCKMYRRLLAGGLPLRRTGLGFGTVATTPARSMYDLGLAALRGDPNLLLCDDPECSFCGAWRRA